MKTQIYAAPAVKGLNKKVTYLYLKYTGDVSLSLKQ